MKRFIFPLTSLLSLALPKIANAAVGDPWDGATTYEDFICKAWGWIATIILPVSILIIVFAGFLWMTSAGNPEKIGKAKEYLIGVASGLGLLVISYFLVNNVLGVDVFSIRGGCIWR